MKSINNTKDAGWRFRTHERTITEVFARYKQNEPFIINIVNMFDYLGNACKLIWNREKALHILFNYYLQEEIHYRHIPDFLAEITQENLPNDDELYHYIKLPKDRFHELFRKLTGMDVNTLFKSSDKIRIRFIEDENKKFLLGNDLFRKMINDGSLLKNKNPIVLIMDVPDGKLGIFILFGRKKESQKSSPFDKDPSSEAALINWSNKIANFLKYQADVKPETYLPSYRKRRHSTKAVILFGDITNFTQLSTMLRIIGTSEDNQKISKELKVKELGKIMQEHCCDMSKIISAHSGRIERFVGDGLMAIFGEHSENPIISLGHAIAAASKMVQKFRNTRKPEIQKIIYGKEGYHEINEMIEIDYGIGVNYGTVLFDYLGDDRHREYSCIGDHVAFADRLMHKAARFDVETNLTWKPILFSQTVEQYIKYWFARDEWEREERDNEPAKKVSRKIMHARGYGYPSYVYGIDADFYNYHQYELYAKELKEITEEQVIEKLKITNNWLGNSSA